MSVIEDLFLLEPRKMLEKKWNMNMTIKTIQRISVSAILNDFSNFCLLYKCKQDGSSQFRGSTANNKEYFKDFPYKILLRLLILSVLP